MDLKELRLGNLVLDKLYGGVVIITKYFFTEGNVNNIEPIQLTEEILLKCGFVKDEFDNWENETRLGLYKPEEFDGYLSIWGESTVGECNYLHQLQNLYFALTGLDLEVSLD